MIDKCQHTGLTIVIISTVSGQSPESRAIKHAQTSIAVDPVTASALWTTQACLNWHTSTRQKSRKGQARYQTEDRGEASAFRDLLGYTAYVSSCDG
jgi:hypothetical protein